ncbi:MAG TPA: glycosyltransferase family 4 protein [Spirochaetota bacterium]|nr:glycosyltransferase family 4 protein [Spirochaetota bacterium]
MSNRTLLLISGLPLDRDTSFRRQLVLLGRFLGRLGSEPVLVGPSPDIGRIVKEKKPAAAILLGYHDQFSFLRDDIDIPVLLWAQLSRPEDPRNFGNATVVPLTPVTGRFLKSSGVERVGPVIPHGVDTDIYRPFDAEEKKSLRKRYGIGGGFVIGAVAANTKRKKLDRIIEAFGLFEAHGGDGTLLIKTDRAKGLDGTDLYDLSHRYEVQKKVLFMEETFNEQRMAVVYNLMDLYISLSEWEGFCIPVIEAMACGVPVVTHRVQGPGEIVPYNDLMVSGSDEVFDGKTRLLLADPFNASKVLLYAYNNSGRLSDLGALGRQVVERLYDIRVVAETWEKLIRNG